ncbi:MAG: S8 family serine peptidase [Pseudomonadota bacterium]
MRVAILVGFALTTAFATAANAAVDPVRLVPTRACLGPRCPRPDDAPRALRNRENGRVSLIVERASFDAAPPRGAIPLADGFFAIEAAPGELAAVAAEHPGLRFDWAPSRRLLLDRADTWISASNVRAATGGTGAGVIVGIVDSGVDVQHDDLRRADGSTRVLWLVDFTRPARGKHPELEAALGCTTSAECAIYSAADIDALIANDVVGDEPRDTIGHGTHVASLAVGDGSSTETPRYVGVAPEAELVVARVTGSGGGITDADIVRAVRFVFERAAELGRPAVVNLSLGSDFGAHDGTSALERALASFVGPEQPGRALVVAAGNSAALLVDDAAQVPGPLGVHTEVHVPRGAPVRVPLVVFAPRPGRAQGGIDVWIEMRPGDALDVAFERAGARLATARPASAVGFAEDDFEGEIFNDTALPGGFGDDPALGAPSAVVLVRGSFDAGTDFALVFEGQGTASVWVQGSGDLDPALGPGVLVPAAFKEGTITVPASDPRLIAVGATLNRIDWTDAEGNTIALAEHGALAPPIADTTAFFSSAGPSALGTLKPDLVAPGAYVVGALSHHADPRRTLGSGMFAPDEHCPPSTDCYLVSASHAIASGTSMAAPLVTGTIALMFERDPTLTQEAVRTLLQAGARRLGGVVFSEQQVGVGVLDVAATFEALALGNERAARRPSSDHCWLTLSASFARPEPSSPLVGTLSLRDAENRLADALDDRALVLDVRGGSIREPLTRIGPGLYRFSVVAPAGSGGGHLDIAVRYRGSLLLERRVPIAVDHHLAHGVATARGGCALSPASSAARGGLSDVPMTTMGVVVLGLLAIRRRRVVSIVEYCRIAVPGSWVMRWRRVVHLDASRPLILRRRRSARLTACRRSARGRVPDAFWTRSGLGRRLERAVTATSADELFE